MQVNSHDMDIQSMTFSHFQKREVRHDGGKRCEMHEPSRYYLYTPQTQHYPTCHGQRDKDPTTFMDKLFDSISKTQKALQMSTDSTSYLV